jgi:hypothetical protein
MTPTSPPHALQRSVVSRLRSASVQLDRERGFGVRHALILALAFAFALALGNVLSWVFERTFERAFHVSIDRPRAWPVSAASFRIPTLANVVLAALTGVFAWAALKRHARRTLALPVLALVVTLLNVSSNAVQGPVNGFETPVAGTGFTWKGHLKDPLSRPYTEAERARDRGVQYWHDAVDPEIVPSVTEFLASFNSKQSSLKTHSRTHPPGAVLTYYIASLVSGTNPVIAALMLGVLATTLLVGASYRLALNVLGRPEDASFVACLAGLLPAFQIYSFSTLDALVATAVLWVLVGISNPHWTPRVLALTVVSAVASSFLTFGWLFVVPVAIGFEWMQQRSLRRSLSVLGGVACVYLALWAGTGFDYLTAFRTASALENPHGFRALVNPASYILTRVECLGDLWVYYGPYLTVGTVLGVRVASTSVRRLFWVALVTFAAMLLTGAYHTGETGRVCLFLYPILLLPIAAVELNSYARSQLVLLAFLQGLVMQLVGSYFW